VSPGTEVKKILPFSFRYDTPSRGESEAGALTDGFRCKKVFENVRLKILRDARTIVANLDDD